MLSSRCTHGSTKMHGSCYESLAHHNIVLSWYKQPNTTLTSTHSMSNNKQNLYPANNLLHNMDGSEPFATRKKRDKRKGVN